MEKQMNPEAALNAAFLSARLNDWRRCRRALEGFFDNVPVENARKFTPRSLPESSLLFKMFVKTGLDRQSEGAASRICFLRAASYLLNNAPPALRMQLDEDFRKIWPHEESPEQVAYHDSEIASFRLGDLSRALGLDRNEIRGILEVAEGTASVVSEERLQLVE